MYRFLGIHFATWAFLLWPLRFLMKITVKPEALDAKTLRDMTEGRQIIYVLPRIYMLDVLVLNIILKSIGVPTVRGEASLDNPRLSSLLAVKPKKNLLGRDTREPFLEALTELVERDTRFHENRIALVPVSIFWGRGVEKQNRHPWIRFLFPDETQATSFHKLLMLLFHIRKIHIHFGKPITREHAVEGLDENDSQTSSALVARRLTRLLMIDFNQERAAAVGPALYELDEVNIWMLRNPEISKLLHDGTPEDFEKNKHKLRKNLKEICANYSVATIRGVEILLDFVWTRIFKGVRVRNFNRVAEVSKGKQVLWMPCHKSHLDYLLLSYLLFKRGLAAPHIAAGVNLSFWPIGPILRRGGAFFIRRSFSGNRLYATTFAQYVHFLMYRGFPVEFFQEGGRSRIGKLLVPKTGMLSMCIASVLKRKATQTVIVPVFFGYDKVMEDDTYARELSGAKKKQESMWQLFTSVRHLFKNFGRVDVSIGEPIEIEKLWFDYVRKESPGLPTSILDLPEAIDIREPTLQKFVKFVSRRVNEGVNAVASASGSAMLTLALTSYQNTEIDRNRLIKMIWLLHSLVGSIRQETGLNVATSVAMESEDEDYLLERGQKNEDESVSDVFMSPMPLGDNREKIVENILRDGIMWEFIVEDEKDKSKLKKKTEKEMNLWWYRGAVFHVFAIPGIVASLLVNDRDAGRVSEISNLIYRFGIIRNIWQDELWLPIEKTNEHLVHAAIRILVDYKVIAFNGSIVQNLENEGSQKAIPFLARLVQPEIEVYGLQLALGQIQAETTGTLERDFILKQSPIHHAQIRKDHKMLSPASLSKVYGNRVFDGLTNSGIFEICSEGGFRFRQEKVKDVQDFFGVAKWKKFIG